MPVIRRTDDTIFKAVAGETADRLEDLRTLYLGDGWVALVGFAYPGRPVRGARTVALLIVPADPSNIPPDGLSHRQLRDAITGLADLGPEVSLGRWRETFGRLGRPWTPELEKQLEKELRRLGRKQAPGGRGSPYPGEFFARVALDAIELAAQGRGSDIVNALLDRYLKADPRPKDRRAKPITYETVKGWYQQAKDRGFLAKPGRKGVRLVAPTERLHAFMEGEGS
jgi:hypothetical protein